MDTSTALLFALTVLPLVFTPGPDMLFVSAQALAGGAAAGLRATAGICLGYCVHSLLVAAGLAALLAARPEALVALRWIGALWLARLAFGMVRSAFAAAAVAPPRRDVAAAGLRRGFVTSLLNPKGMMIYFALLPQFVRPGADLPVAAAVLSAIFVGLCALAYAVLSVVAARVAAAGGLGDRHRRLVVGASGAMLAGAAVLFAAV